MRAYRARSEPSPDSVLRHRARSHVHVYLSRRKIAPERCNYCGGPPVTFRHRDLADRTRRLDVYWVCREHR